jgi:hypothetical protein
MITEVINEKVAYGRTGILNFIGNEVLFDTSDGEYGPLIISIKLLEEKLKEHKEKLNKQL